MLSRSTWFSIHSWLGLKLSILLCFIVMTGTLAVISNEIDWLANPAKRVAPSGVDGMHWLAVYQNAQQHASASHRIDFIAAPIHPWFSAQVIYRDKDNQRYRLFFHPSTGEYLGEGRWLNWQRFFRETHRHLMLPLTLGITIVSAFGIVMLAILVSSLYLYRRWWKGFTRAPRWHHRQTRWGDLHRLVGVWSLWFLLVLGLTGTWYLAERWGAGAPAVEKGQAVTIAAIDAPVMPSNERLKSMLGQAHQQYSSLDIQEIHFPKQAGDVVEFQGQASAILVRNRANMIQFDPISADAVFQQKAENLSLHARIAEAADPLHFGVWGMSIGSRSATMASKLLYFVFGILLSGLCITGAYMYGMRVGRVHSNSTHIVKQTWKIVFTHSQGVTWVFASAITLCLGYGAFTFLVN